MPAVNTSLPINFQGLSPISSQLGQGLMPVEEKAAEPFLNDIWCGVLSERSRQIPNTPYVLSRVDDAVFNDQDLRLNAHGYDRDNPKDAIQKYEKAHQKSIWKRGWHAFTSTVFNLVTFCVPGILSLSAGRNKQRIDQKIILQTVRESVDKYPELKIRVMETAWSLMSPGDQVRWREHLSVIRTAQHDYIANKLAEKYPGHINQTAPTILYTGGRATGLLRVLYCSVDEYVALYWSDWGLKSTDSGSYRSHVYDYITEGQNVNWDAKYLEIKEGFEVTQPGEYTFLGSGDRKVWSFEGPCGMIDHGIGDVISMSKFAIVSNLSTTLNGSAVVSLLTNQAKAVAHEYYQRFKETVKSNVQVEVKEVHRVSDEALKEARCYFAGIMSRITPDKNEIS